MGNMSYCRFENTNNDLADCEDHVGDMDLSETENKQRISLIERCISIASQYEGTNLEEEFADNGEASE